MTLDNQIPSVSEILHAVGLAPSYTSVPPAVLERKRLLGIALHRAIQYDVETALDEASVHPEIADSLALWRRFRSDSGFRVLHSELELVHPRWRFQGHPDLICEAPVGHTVILDIKHVASVDTLSVTLQLAGYRLLVQDVLGLPAACAALQIHNGAYRYIDLTEKAIVEVKTFLAALVVFRAQQRRQT